MNKLNFLNKNTGDTLEASEWNSVVSKVDEIVDSVNNGGGGSGTVIDSSGMVLVSSKGNTEIHSNKHINLEPAYDSTGGSGTYGDIQMKPGDDITLESSHRAASKLDEITIKTTNGKDGTAKAPVKLQIISADLTLSSKGKTGTDSNVTNINVTTGSGKGYLKVRAQAIDMRCEEHGGVAIQPNGFDSDNHMNKIKFEHGGGDGLEFGTFNTDKTSIYTGEYRFNKHGLVKMATRTPVASDKMKQGKLYNNSLKLAYLKADDDFYDNVAEAFHIENQTKIGDEQATWLDIIKTAYSLNGDLGVKTGISKKGNFLIETLFTKFYWRAATETELTKIDSKILELSQADITPYFSLAQLSVENIGNLSFDSITLNSSESKYSPTANANGVTVEVPFTPGELESALNKKKHDAVKLLNDLIRTRYIRTTESVNYVTTSDIEAAEYKDASKAITSRDNIAVEDRKYIYLVYDEELQLYVWECKKKSKVPAAVVTFNDASDISTYTLNITTPTTKAEIDNALTVAYECPATITSGGSGATVAVQNINYTPAGVMILSGLEDGARNINIESGNTVKLEAPHVELIGEKDVTIDSANVNIKNAETLLTVGTSSITITDLVTFIAWAKANNQGPWAIV